MELGECLLKDNDFRYFFLEFHFWLFVIWVICNLACIKEYLALRIIPEYWENMGDFGIGLILTPLPLCFGDYVL